MFRVIDSHESYHLPSVQLDTCPKHIISEPHHSHMKFSYSHFLKEKTQEDSEIAQNLRACQFPTGLPPVSSVLYHLNSRPQSSLLSSSNPTIPFLLIYSGLGGPCWKERKPTFSKIHTHDLSGGWTMTSSYPCFVVVVVDSLSESLLYLCAFSPGFLMFSYDT